METVSEKNSALVKRLRRLDCCAVSDALDKLRVDGVITGLPQLSGQGKIAGVAVTFKVGVGEPPAGKLRHLGSTAVELSGPDNIIVVEQSSNIDAGCWGGLLTLGAKTRGVAGVVANGPVRDIDEARAYDFSIYGHTVSPRTARGRVVELGTNVPVAVGQVSVNPGDFILADGSGIVAIAAEIIEDVLPVAEEIVAKEAAMAKAILQGTQISEVMGGAYELMLQDAK